MRFDNRRMLRAVGGISLAAVLLSGCSYRSHTTRMAVDYNEFIAQTTNRQTVLNILRASQREPMHFSSFSEVSGSISGSAGVQLGSAFNGDSRSDVVATGTEAGATASSVTRTVTDSLNATNFTPQLSLEVETGTDFTVLPNATEEFYRGILNPIPDRTVVHYLRQGFPADLLSHLLLGRLEFTAVITDPDGREHRKDLDTVVNSPDEEGVARFARAIRCRQLDYVMTETKARRIPLNDLSAVTPLNADVARRISVDGDATYPNLAYQVPEQTGFDLVLSERIETQACDTIIAEFDAEVAKWLADLPPKEREKTGTPHDCGPVPPRAPLTALLSSRPRAAQSETAVDAQELPLGQPGELGFSSKCFFNQLLPTGWRGDLVIDTTLRSVHGVLYYLGEYIRDSATSPKLGGRACNEDYCLPILVVHEADKVAPEERFAEVRYRGRTYAVPLSGGDLKPAAGRSSQTIDLVQQLLNLNRSSKDLPTTPLVRVAN